MRLTKHAVTRAIERGITLNDIELVSLYGTPVRASGAIFTILFDRDLEEIEEQGLKARLNRLRNLVVLEIEGKIVTSYKNKSTRSALREIRGKQKYRKWNPVYRGINPNFPDAA